MAIEVSSIQAEFRREFVESGVGLANRRGQRSERPVVAVINEVAGVPMFWGKGKTRVEIN